MLVAKFWQRGLRTGIIAIGVVLSGSFAVLATETSTVLEGIDTTYAQWDSRNRRITSVSELQDIQSSHWAFIALKDLAERYGCLVGYPNGRFGGDRTLSRFEFAVGFNACLQNLKGAMQTPAVEVTSEDLGTLHRLQETFATELQNLSGRITVLEVRSATLVETQFSPTVKLHGQIAFSTTGAFGDEKADDSDDNIEENIIFDSRTRLFFNSSFTGRDRLVLRLDALKTTSFGVGVTGTNMTRLAFDRSTDSDLVIGRLFYRFSATPKFRVTVDAAEGRFDTAISNTFNPAFASSFNGAISNFGRFNPIYIQGRRGTGITAVYDFNDSLSLSLGYMARNADNPSAENGLYDGSFAALTQLEIKPSEEFSLGVTYVRAYYPEGQAFVSGATGSRLSNAPFGPRATSANHFGLETSWQVGEKVTLSGWVGATLAQAEDDGPGFGGVPVADGDDSFSLNWAVTLAARDLAKEGSVAGFIVGQQPRVMSNDSGPEDADMALHLEALYHYPINANITLNPGLIFILNPEHEADNSPIYVGALRMLFEF